MNLTRLRMLVAEKGEGDPVMKALFALAGDSLVYLSGAAMIGLGNFVLVPLYTRYLSPAQFGVYALVDIAVLMMVSVVGLGFNVSYLKWYAETDEASHPKLLGTVVLTATLVALLGGTLLAGSIASPMGECWLQTPTSSFAWVLLPIVALENLQTLLLTDLRARRRALAFSTGSVVRLIGMVGASLWFVAIQKQGVTGVFLGRLLGDVLGVVILAGFCLRHFSPSVSWHLVKPMICFGAPVIWGALAAMLLDASGRYFLSHYSTLEQVGFYSAGVKVSNVMRILLTLPFGIAWGGVMFQIAQWPKARMIYSKAFEHVLVVALLIALGAALFAPTLFHIFTTSAYLKAVQVFSLLLLVQVCTIAQYPASIGLYLKDKTLLFVPIYAISVVINFIFNWLLVPNIGMQGAAIAFLSGWIVTVGLELLFTYRYYPLQIKWGTVVLAVIIFYLISLAGKYTALGITLKDIMLQTLYFVTAVMVTGVWGIADFRRHWRRIDDSERIKPNRLISR